MKNLPLSVSEKLEKNEMQIGKNNLGSNTKMENICGLAWKKEYLNLLRE